MTFSPGTVSVECHDGLVPFTPTTRRNMKCDVCDGIGQVMQKCGFCGFTTCKTCFDNGRFDPGHDIAGLEFKWSRTDSSRGTTPSAQFAGDSTANTPAPSRRRLRGRPRGRGRGRRRGRGRGAGSTARRQQLQPQPQAQAGHDTVRHDEAAAASIDHDDDEDDNTGESDDEDDNSHHHSYNCDDGYQPPAIAIDLTRMTTGAVQQELGRAMSEDRRTLGTRARQGDLAAIDDLEAALALLALRRGVPLGAGDYGRWFARARAHAAAGEGKGGLL